MQTTVPFFYCDTEMADQKSVVADPVPVGSDSDQILSLPDFLFGKKIFHRNCCSHFVSTLF